MLPSWISPACAAAGFVMAASYRSQYPRALTTLFLQQQNSTGLPPLPAFQQYTCRPAFRPVIIDGRS